ncbi:restriction endonuclease subunit S [Streptomyces albidoflavus]
MKHVPLKYVAAIKAGQSPPSSEVEALASGTPFLQGNAEFGSLHPAPRFECSSAPKVAAPGEILLSVRAPVGALNIADVSYGIGRGLCAVKASSCDSRFLWWWLHGQRQNLHRVSTGSTYKAVSAEDVGALEFPVLGISEQRAIASLLDVEIPRIDRLIGLRRRQEFRLEQRRYAFLSEKLVPGTLRHAPGDGMYSWLPDLPEDLPMVKLGYLCKIQNGLTVDGARKVVGDVVTRPYLRVANVQADRLELDSVSEITVPRAVADRCTLRRGDVLMTEGGDLDKLGRGTVWGGEIADCLHQNHVFALRPDGSLLDSRYLSLLTQSLHGRCYFESTGSKTTNLASTNSNKILSFPIPLPVIKRQKELVVQVEEGVQVIAKARALLRRQRALLVGRRQALITAAVTGQFDASTASGRNVTDVTDGVTRV